MNRRILAAPIVGCALLAVGCLSLDTVATVETNERSKIIGDPLLIERGIGGSFVTFWDGMAGNAPFVNFALLGEEITSSSDATASMFNVTQEPRPDIVDLLSGTSSFSRQAWTAYYRANAMAVDMTRIIKQNNVIIRDQATGADNTPRALMFAKFIQGMSHLQLAMIYDSAAIVGESVDLTQVAASGEGGIPWSPYPVVLDSGVKFMEEAIAQLDAREVLFPLRTDLWMIGQAMTSSQVANVAHSYLARSIAYSARNPTERAAVPWAKVKEHILQGISAPFGPIGSPGDIAYTYTQIVTSPPNGSAPWNSAGGFTLGGAARVDLRLLGPGDTLLNPATGRTQYQDWLAKVVKLGRDTVVPFIVRSPDKRIQPPELTAPLAKPTYFKFTSVLPGTATSQMPPDRGAYYRSNYWSSSRANNDGTQNGGRNSTGNLDLIQTAVLLPVEMRLLLAEAEFWLGNKDQTVAIINETRVPNGELPPVTLAGPPQATAAQRASCVPRRFDGTCGDLWDALMYEKRIETYGTTAAYFDLRGWGCLLPGTMLHLAPPATQLLIAGNLIYGYGGHADKPGNSKEVGANCRIISIPGVYEITP
jgi:hypothetical protein